MGHYSLVRDVAVRLLCGSFLILFSAAFPTDCLGQTESVKIDFELLLNKCKGNACHIERVVHKETHVSLEEEDPTFYWGYVPIEEHIGKLAYQLRFNVSRVSRGKTLVRSLAIGFSGRVGALTGKQLTWAEKEFKGENWDVFNMASTSGSKYSEDEETIVPTLRVLRVSAFP